MRHLIKPPNVTLTVPQAHVPWGLLGACAVLALIGIALWRVTIGKVLIVAAITATVTILVLKY